MWGVRLYAGTGCNLDNAYVWTSTVCGEDSFLVARGTGSTDTAMPMCIEGTATDYGLRCCSDTE